MKFLQLLVFVFYPFVLFSQISITNTSLNDKSQNQVYQTLDNGLVISGVKRFKNLSFKANEAETDVINDSTLTLRPGGMGSDTLRVLSNNKLLYAWPFIVDTIPYPIVRVGSINDTVLTVQQILISPVLRVVFPFTNWNHPVTVWRFSSFSTDHTEGNETEESSMSNQLTEKQLKIIRQLRSGDKIFFDGIYGGGPDSRVIKFPSFTVLIK